MGLLAEMFSFSPSNSTVPQDEFPVIYPLGVERLDFVTTDVFSIYCKILTDVVERISGLSPEQSAILWDNCVRSSSSDGLVTLLAEAMSEKSDLFLVLDSGILRRATSTEQQEIKADYEREAKSSAGVFISFKNYDRTDMIKLYSALEFDTVDALNKSMNLSGAIQIKMENLRSTTGLTDSAGVSAQAAVIAKGLKSGRSVLLDAKDTIVTTIPDLTSVKSSIQFLEGKRAFYLGLPASYITGEQTSAMGADGSVDAKPTERGLKSYYFSIMKPALEAIFEGVKLKYKSQDAGQIQMALEALKTFDLVSDQYLSAEQKKATIESMLDIDADDNQVEAPPEIDVTPPAAPKAKEVTA